ncbi:MAG: hypothetical protein LBD97_01570, partial [Bifidobacteriaceae bacterium]|nr:hypothetical protein [Bifidobacteriaceae bacterium]
LCPGFTRITWSKAYARVGQAQKSPKLGFGDTKVAILRLSRRDSGGLGHTTGPATSPTTSSAADQTTSPATSPINSPAHGSGPRSSPPWPRRQPLARGLDQRRQLGVVTRAAHTLHPDDHAAGLADQSRTATAPEPVLVSRTRQPPTQTKRQELGPVTCCAEL